MFRAFYTSQLIMLVIFAFYGVITKKLRHVIAFITALQLTSYLAMHDLLMPPSLLIFLMSYLNTVRLKIPDLNLSDKSIEDSLMSGVTNTYLQLFGYGQLFFNNAPLLIGLFVFCVILFALATAKDRLP